MEDVSADKDEIRKHQGNRCKVTYDVRRRFESAALRSLTCAF